MQHLESSVVANLVAGSSNLLHRFQHECGRLPARRIDGLAQQRFQHGDLPPCSTAHRQVQSTATHVQSAAVCGHGSWGDRLKGRFKGQRWLIGVACSSAWIRGKRERDFMADWDLGGEMWRMGEENA